MTTENNTTCKKMTSEELEEQSGINVDALNGLLERLEQLSAMLTITYGNESFDEWCGDVKDNYLWACSTMLEQAKEMAERINLSTIRIETKQ